MQSSDWQQEKLNLATGNLTLSVLKSQSAMRTHDVKVEAASAAGHGDATERRTVMHNTHAHAMVWGGGSMTRQLFCERFFQSLFLPVLVRVRQLSWSRLQFCWAEQLLLWPWGQEKHCSERPAGGSRAQQV